MRLIPDSWRQDVPGATLPGLEAEVDGWREFAIAESGQRRKANEQKRDGFEIIERCEARDAEVVKALTPRSWWQKVTPWTE